MQEFDFRVVTGSGERLAGRLAAPNKDRARSLLSRQYAAILELEESQAGSSTEPKAFKVPVPRMAIFFRRLATMLGAGVQLVEALEFLAESEDDPELKKAIEDLRLGVSTGSSLSGTMSGMRFRRIVDPVSIGMIQVGEKTGELLKVVDKIADQIEHNVKLTRSIVSALTYPLVLFAVIVILALLFTLVLAPGEGGLLSAVGEDLPWPTQVLKQASDLVRRPWLGLACLGCIALAVSFVRRRLESDRLARLWFHSLLLRTPGLGGLILKTEVSRMLYVMADGLAVGLPLTHCLALSREVCRNEVVQQQVERIQRSFADGDEFSDALQNGQVFPSMVLSMLEVGVESGRLDSVMTQVCQVYEDDVEMALASVSRLAEPLLLCFAGVVAAFFALAALLPIINLTRTL